MRAQISKFLLFPSLHNLDFGSFSAIAETPIHQVSSETCEICHNRMYNKWKGSMHAQSTALNDPIHGTFYGMVIGDPTKKG